jgi:putative oxidoreductase
MRDLLLLRPLARFADGGLLLLRLVTGAFLIYQSQDNILSGERMQLFVDFCRRFGIPWPELAAPLSVWCQLAAGIGFVLGLLTRWLGLVTAINFAVACAYVHWRQDFPGWWPALVLVFLGLYFATRGAGKFSVDQLLERRTRV